MQRFTISLDDTLAQQFDELIADKGYENRSEAVRDLIRSRLQNAALHAPAQGAKQATVAWCVANVSYVYDHHEQTVTARVLKLQHDHHDLVVTSLHTHLDHDHCLETLVLRGPVQAVQTLADQLMALRGVRHGHVHVIPMAPDPRGGHSHGALPAHVHLKPAH